MASTTSWEVGPAGLSMRRAPSSVLNSVMGAMGGVEGAFAAGNDLALHQEGMARQAGAGRGVMAAAAEWGGDFIDVDLVSLGAEADAGEVGPQFLEDAGDDDRFDGADVVDEALRVVRPGARAGEIGLLQPEIGDPVLVCEVKMIVDVLQQAHARERIGLVNLVANPGEVGAALDEFAGDGQRGGRGAGILERAGVSGDGGEKIVGDERCDRPIGGFEQMEDQFPGGRFPVGDPVQVTVAGVAGVVIDIDEQFSRADVPRDLAKALEAGAVGGDDAVELASPLWRAENLLRIQEGALARDGMLVPAGARFAFILEGVSQAELRADAIAIGTDVADDAEGGTAANPVEDAPDDFRFHVAGPDFSSSSMMASTRLPRSMESSTMKRRCGTYFRMTALATRDWMRERCLFNMMRPVRCCSALPRMPMKTVARRRSPATSTSLTVMTPAWSMGISRRMASPISRFNSSRTRWSRWEGMLDIHGWGRQHQSLGATFSTE